VRAHILNSLGAEQQARRETGDTHDMMKRMLGRDGDMVKRSPFGWMGQAEKRSRDGWGPGSWVLRPQSWVLLLKYGWGTTSSSKTRRELGARSR
jgi:hypothetical protein